MDGTQREELERAAALAAEHLGPASRAHLERPEVQALVLARRREGTEPIDAVLGMVHQGAARDQDLAGEFVQYFVRELLVDRGRTRPGAIAGIADTEDLVQSVLADLWPEFQTLTFETRARFLRLLSQRVQWKSVDKVRHGRRQRRREDRRVAESPDELRLAGEDPSPLSEADAQDQSARLHQLLEELSPRDRALLERTLDGAGVEEIMEEFDLQHEAARKALQRARKRAEALGRKFRENSGEE